MAFDKTSGIVNYKFVFKQGNRIICDIVDIREYMKLDEIKKWIINYTAIYTFDWDRVCVYMDGSEELFMPKYIIDKKIEEMRGVTG